MQLHRLSQDDAASLELLDNADLVIAALGYRPRALPVFNESGRPVPLLGLAAGFVPHGKLGGEPSFKGQANGLWLWQSDVGGLIVDALLAPCFAQEYLPELPTLGRWEQANAMQEVEA